MHQVSHQHADAKISGSRGSELGTPAVEKIVQADPGHQGQQNVYRGSVRRIMVMDVRAARADRKYKPIHQKKRTEAASHSDSGKRQAGDLTHFRQHPNQSYGA
jgi:hypothetical protein